MATKLPRKFEITEKRLILCEGPHDRAFFRHLVDQCGLPACNIACTIDLTGSPGVSGFAEFLRKVRPLDGFGELEDIVIVADCENDAEASFEFVASMIRNVPPPQSQEPAHEYSVPVSPQVRQAGTPAVTVMMVPWFDRCGALETLFLDTLQDRHNVMQCIAQFGTCSGADHWPAQKKDKMRLRSFFAAYNYNRPDQSLGRLWIDNPNLFPIEHAAFDQIRNFLRAL